MFCRAVALALAFVLFASAPAFAADGLPLSETIRRAQIKASPRIRATETKLPAAQFPWYTESSGAWSTTPASGWTSGYLAGQEWLEYERTGAASWRSRALRRQSAIAAQRTNPHTHDLGVMFGPSFVNAYRLTGSRSAKSTALVAADTLARRWDPKLGMIRSRNTKADFQVIIDGMMTLELLHWASRNGGSSGHRDKAIRHSLRTGRDFVRPDGSTYQLVVYNKYTGRVIRKGTRQGAAAESTWSRGQAWAIYGFAIAYRETRDARFLETARKCSDWYLEHLPADHVPYWDFSVSVKPGEPRDSSAAAIAASGLIELALAEPDSRRAAHYLRAAADAIESLSSPAYQAGPGLASVLDHGTQSRPFGYFDTGLSFGDYYYLEAMMKMRRAPRARAPLPVETACANSASSSNKPSAVLDNDPSTLWNSASRGGWIRIDLGESRPVSGVGISTWRGTFRSASYSIQVSDDGTTWKTVASPRSSGQASWQESYDFAPVQGRFVRVVCMGTTAGSATAITELRVY